nr:hypothetical protein [Tanacetum cinerariifolium]
MFIQPHDPDFVPEPIYPEYIPLKDEHMLPAEEQPLPPIVSPTDESPEYVTESDPEEDQKEYEDDKTEDGLVDYPMDGEMMEMMMTTIHLGMTLTMRMRKRRTRRMRSTLLRLTPLLLYLLMSLFPHLREQSLDDILETKMPPRKRLCLSTLGSRYEVGESSTARPTRGRGIDYWFVSTLDAEAR